MKKSITSIILLAIGISSALAQQLKVEFVTPDIVRVQYSHDGKFLYNATGACIYDKQAVDVKRTETADRLMLQSKTLQVVVSKHTNAISFLDCNGKEILAQLPGSVKYEPSVQERVIYDEKSAHVEETANGKVTVKDILRRDTIGLSTRYFVSFRANDEKGIYGLGAHMEDYLNLQGKTMYLTQHNLKASVPVLCSTGGYGLLFDAGCAMKYSSESDAYTMQLEAARELDYYFIRGKKMEDVVAGYRYLTGKPSLMPRWLFGYTQSKERYVSSDDIIRTLREYRRRHIPIDMIVQDWNYWPQGWGYMKMNPKYYPDPKVLADSVHAMNAKLMVSIWPNPQWCPEAEDFKKRGMMLEHDIYDAFNPEARKHYWKYANDEFFSRGFDAWWCDSSEPLDGDWNRIPGPTNGKPYGWDSQEQRWSLNKDVLSEALGVERSSLFSLYHSMGIYENQRLTTNDKRVVNLTRSTFAGQQRYGTIVWNGDTHASWQSFRQQVPSGLNYMATGNPYWTVDVGSFFTRNDGRRWFYKGEFQNGVKDDAYKDYYVRMFQWATFLPMLRSHGSDTPREVWQFENSQTKGNAYYDELLRMINLRYQLIPYIYSMAAQQTFGGYTMARLLAFDFPTDDTVLDMKDEYMFGDFLVCPVTEPSATSRKVYLPKGTAWIDYWTGNSYQGGQWIESGCAIKSCKEGEGRGGSIPLFVRAGSIITTTEAAEYSDAQKGKPVTISIYPGADTTFHLYEDEGDNYNYEQGQCTIIPLSWNDGTHTLTIGKRQGSYSGMQARRTFHVTLPDGTHRNVTYNGKKSNIRL